MNTYYYAGGAKVEIEQDDEHIGVDRKAVPAELLGRLSAAFEGAPQQPGGMAIAPKAAIGQRNMALLKKAGALHPVFRRHGAMLVPLPEIRVEFDGKAQRKSVDKVLAQADQRMLVTEASDERMVLAPASGSATDALQMANDIYERAHPAAAAVRFLQFVPRPGSKR
ncbi:hypothetical protein [Pseudorhodoferax sp.]|uniref:hypothetical protein n=1 Tax=Pseudorhodoferax sp. TaxID=1993553 RepID=UPI002DD63473|nr:hypothetical protein [Pseudorhodoferax sp.]